jgi:hypothetical protein
MEPDNGKIYDLSEFVKKYRCHPEGDCGPSWLMKDIIKHIGIEQNKLEHAERISKPIKDSYFGCNKECMMNGLLYNILAKEERMSLRGICQTHDIEVYKFLNGVKDENEAGLRWANPEFGRDGKSLAEIFAKKYEEIEEERKHKLKEASE